MIRARLLALAVGAAALGVPGQNLLSWSAWQPWNAQYVTQLSITTTDIYFAPYDPLQVSRCGLDQVVTLPTTGWYQLHFHGQGGISGYISASWTIAGHRRDLTGEHRQLAWAFQAPAGPHVLRFDTMTSSISADQWWFEQPILRPVLAPAVDADLQDSNVGAVFPAAWFSAPGHVLAFAPRRTSAPISIPGFGHGLELDPTSGIVVVATSPAGIINLVRSLSAIFRQSWPGFYLQALSIAPVPTFGSRLYVAPWTF